MKLPLLKRLDDLRSNFWFVPLLMATGGVVLALVVGWADRQAWALRIDGIVEVAGPAGARSILSTVAASAITVAGVIFSVTLVSLSLAATQLGPRLLRNYLQRGGTQTVMGLFLGTFLFCLIALRGVPDGSFDDTYVPRLAVLVGLMLGFGSFLGLLAFVHRMVHFIQAPNVLAAVADELRTSIVRTFPERDGGDAEPPTEGFPDLGDEPTCVVRSSRGGYVQALDYPALAGALKEVDALAVLHVRPGQFVWEHDPLAAIHASAEADLDAGSLERFFVLGHTRSATQDPEFVLSQFVEVAVRALSPGINDPFTACAAVDRIGEGLRLAAARRSPARFVADGEGCARVRTREPGFPALVASAFDCVREHARRDLSTTLRLLHTIAAVAPAGPPPDFAQALREQVDHIVQGARASLLVDADRQALDRRNDVARRALEPLLPRGGIQSVLAEPAADRE